MKCIICKKSLEDIGDDNQPIGGLSFHSYGHYGTSVFDPMDGTYLEINVCDECVTKGRRGRQCPHGVSKGHNARPACQVAAAARDGD